MIAALGASLALTGCYSSKEPYCAAVDNVAHPSLAPGLHTLKLTAGTPVPVSGMNLTLTLPPGVEVLTEGPGSNQVLATSLKPLNSSAGVTLVYGNYRAEPNTVELAMASTQASAWSGDFLQLDFRTQPGAAVTAESIQALNVKPAAYKVVGVDPVKRTSMDITAQVTTSVTVIR